MLFLIVLARLEPISRQIQANLPLEIVCIAPNNGDCPEKADIAKEKYIKLSFTNNTFNDVLLSHLNNENEIFITNTGVNNYPVINIDSSKTFSIGTDSSKNSPQFVKFNVPKTNTAEKWPILLKINDKVQYSTPKLTASKASIVIDTKTTKIENSLFECSNLGFDIGDIKESGSALDLDMTDVVVTDKTYVFNGKNGFEMNLKLPLTENKAKKYQFDSMKYIISGKMNAGKVEFIEGATFEASTNFNFDITTLVCFKSSGFVIGELNKLQTLILTDKNPKSLKFGENLFELDSYKFAPIMSEFQLHIESLDQNFVISSSEGSDITKVYKMKVQINDYGKFYDYDLTSPTLSGKTFEKGLEFIGKNRRIKIYRASYAPQVSGTDFTAIEIKDTMICYGTDCPSQIGRKTINSQKELNDCLNLLPDLDLVVATNINNLEIPEKFSKNVKISKHGTKELSITLTKVPATTKLSIKDLKVSSTIEINSLETKNCVFDNKAIKINNGKFSDQYDTISADLTVKDQKIKLVINYHTITTRVTFTEKDLGKGNQKNSLLINNNFPLFEFGSNNIILSCNQKEYNSNINPFTINTNSNTFSVDYAHGTSYVPAYINMPEATYDVTSSISVFKLNCKAISFKSGAKKDLTVSQYVETSLVEGVTYDSVLNCRTGLKMKNKGRISNANIATNKLILPNEVTIEKSKIDSKAFESAQSAAVSIDVYSLGFISKDITYKELSITDFVSIISMDEVQTTITVENEIRNVKADKIKIKFKSGQLTLEKVTRSQIEKLVLVPENQESTEINIVEKSGILSTDTLYFSSQVNTVTFNVKSSAVIPTVLPVAVRHALIDNSAGVRVPAETNSLSTTNQLSVKFTSNSVIKDIVFDDLSITGNPVDTEYTTEEVALLSPNIKVDGLTVDLKNAVVSPKKSLEIKNTGKTIRLRTQTVSEAVITVHFKGENDFPKLEHASILYNDKYPKSLIFKPEMTNDALNKMFESGKTVVSKLSKRECENWLDAFSLEFLGDGYTAQCNKSGNAYDLRVAVKESVSSQTEGEGLSGTTISIIVVSVIIGVVIIAFVLFLVFKNKIIAIIGKDTEKGEKKKRRRHRNTEKSVLEDIENIPPASDIEEGDQEQEGENGVFNVNMPMKLPPVPSRVRMSSFNEMPTNDQNNIPTQFQRPKPLPGNTMNYTMAGTMGPISGQRKKREFYTAPTAFADEV